MSHAQKSIPQTAAIQSVVNGFVLTDVLQILSTDCLKATDSIPLDI